MVRFGGSSIAHCNFNNVTILCYEPNTCKSIKFNNKEFPDAEAKNEFKLCNREEIDEILTKIENKKGSPFVIIGIIIGSIVVVLIGILVTIILIRKSKSKEHNNSDVSFNDESIIIDLNESQNNNSGIAEINNNNSNNDNNDNNANNNNNDNNNNNNNNTLNNLNQNNSNSNILINLNNYNINTLPERIILINNPQNTGNFVTGSMPLLNLKNMAISNIGNGNPPEYTE